MLIYQLTNQYLFVGWGPNGGIFHGSTSRYFLGCSGLGGESGGKLTGGSSRWLRGNVFLYVTKLTWYDLYMGVSENVVYPIVPNGYWSLSLWKMASYHWEY